MDQMQNISSILPHGETSKLIAIEKELSDAWTKRQIFRTETEARFGVLNDYKYPTRAAKYWQSIREQMAHFDELTGLSFELRRKKIDLKENAQKLVAAEGYERERVEIDRDELLFQIVSMEQVAKDRVREIMQWSELKKEVNDGSFDDKDPNTHQRESLFKSVLNRAQVSTEELPPEEILSMKGILLGLKDEPVNKNFVKDILEK